MSIFLCCGSQRRGRRSGDDGELSPSPKPNLGQTNLNDIHTHSENSQTSLKIHTQLRDGPIMASGHTCEAPLDLDQLVVDDSDCEGEGHGTLTKTSSALNLVRTKLSNHISNDNESSRRSRTSAGYSQEEIARRAELRRFRHQRIQDELNSEEGNDEASNKSNHSTRYLSPLIDVGQPGGGPRDTIEFAVDGGHCLPTLCISPMPSFSSTDAANENTCNITRKTSSSSEPGENGATKPSNVKHGDQSSPHGLEATSDLFTTRPPSSRSSMTNGPNGCSYNSLRLNRVLGSDEFNFRHGTHAWEEQSALGIWLIAQGLRTRSNSTNRSRDIELNETSSHTMDLGGIDRVADTPPPTHQQGPTVPCNSPESLSDLGISRQLPEHDSTDASTFSSSSNNALGRKYTRELKVAVPTRGPDVPMKNCALDNVAIRVDNNSSNYPSVMPSFQPSPDRSQSNAYHLSAEDLESLELSPFSWQGKFSVSRDFRGSEGKSSYATAEDNASYSCSDNNGSNVQIMPLTAQAQLDLTSPLHSETASFRQRETELRTIEKRFGEVMPRKKLTPNFSSRFKEEFHVGSTGTGRMSLMAKIVSRRSKHEHGSNTSSTVQSRSFSATGDSFAPRSGNTNGNTLKNAGKGSPLPLSDQPISAGRSISLSMATWRSDKQHRDVVLEKSQLAPLPDGFALHQAQQPSRQILRQWTANMKSNFSNGPELIADHLSKTSCKLSEPPQSWARYPSHAREERVRQTSLQENTMLKDVLSEGQLHLNPCQRHISDTLVADPGSRFLPGKLGKVMRSGFNRLIHPRNALDERIIPFHMREDDRRPMGYVDGPGSSVTLEHTMGQEANGTGITSNSTQEGIVSAPEYVSLPPRSGSIQLPPCNNQSSLEIRSRTGTKIVRAETGTNPRLVEESDQTHHDESEVMADMFVTPLSRLKFKDEGDADTDRDSASTVSNTRIVLRRWNSTVNKPVTNREPLAWTGTAMAQSLSVGNLKT